MAKEKKTEKRAPQYLKKGGKVKAPAKGKKPAKFM